MSKWRWYDYLGCLVAAVILIGLPAFAFVVMDGLTRGGLWDNPTWQELRKLWGGN